MEGEEEAEQKNNTYNGTTMTESGETCRMMPSWKKRKTILMRNYHNMVWRVLSNDAHSEEEEEGNHTYDGTTMTTEFGKSCESQSKKRLENRKNRRKKRKTILKTTTTIFGESCGMMPIRQKRKKRMNTDYGSSIAESGKSCRIMP